MALVHLSRSMIELVNEVEEDLALFNDEISREGLEEQPTQLRYSRRLYNREYDLVVPAGKCARYQIAQNSGNSLFIRLRLSQRGSSCFSVVCIVRRVSRKCQIVSLSTREQSRLCSNAPSLLISSMAIFRSMHLK